MEKGKQWTEARRRELPLLGVRFFLAAALCAARIGGGEAPFALGCVAAAGPGAMGGSALVGCVVGAALFMDFAQALPFLAAAVLILSAATAFRDLKLLEARWFLPVTAAGLFLAVSGIYVLQSLAPLEDLSPCAAATVLVGLAVWYYQPLLWPGRERLEPDSLLFLAGSLLLALTDLELLGVSVGRALLCALLLYTAYQRGTVAGAAAGMGAGLTADFLAGEGGL